MYGGPQYTVTEFPVYSSCEDVIFRGAEKWHVFQTDGKPPNKHRVRTSRRKRSGRLENLYFNLVSLTAHLLSVKYII